jgi:acyl-CoA synthetase (AMP-forming)/AMP-acid ligase II
MLSHANLLVNMRSILGILPVVENDQCLVVLPFYYSFGNSILTTHLASGASLVLQNNIAFPRRVLERIGRDKISALYGVPLSFSLLFGKGVAADMDLSSLRYLAQAGGPMRPAQIEQLRRVLPGTDIFIMYGQTEATARLTCLPPDTLDTKPGSAGKAIPDVEIQIRSADGLTVECGESGEIWARGPNVMMGYWNDPSESAQVLRDDWLWTRDRGHLDEDGYLYIEGRSSDMIKIGANRVSPDEIEEVILGLDGIEDVGVVGIHDVVLGQSVLAVVVPKLGFDITELKVKAYCLKQLATYKIPKKIVLADNLPRTSTGKLQRQLLAQMVSGVNR